MQHKNLFKSSPIDSSRGFLDFIGGVETLSGKTKEVSEFYEKEPFPNYNNIANRYELASISRQGKYASALDSLIKDESICVEVGCGTGQLSNFLGLKPNRFVYGMDLSCASLDLAIKFKKHNSITNVDFVRGNIFSNPFKDSSVDVVVSNGVLHHTEDTWRALEFIHGMLLPNGYAVIGLYNSYGRWRTNLIRKISKILGRSFLSKIDPMRFRKGGENSKALNSWINDQYFHPLERSHSYDETIRESRKIGFEIVGFIPDIMNYYREEPLNLELSKDIGGVFDRLVTQINLGIKEHDDGGFYSVVLRKVP